MLAKLFNALFDRFGHRVCCARIPEWTAHVGQKWRPIDEAPFNLYNVIWAFQNWIRYRME